MTTYMIRYAIGNTEREASFDSWTARNIFVLGYAQSPEFRIVREWLGRA